MNHDYLKEAPPQPKQQPIIDLKLTQIEHKLAHISETSNRIKMAVNRLTNPAPEEIGKDSAQHPVNSVEGRLQVIIDHIDSIVAQTDVIANRLDGAV